MKDVIKQYMQNNPSTLYRDLPKVFGLSLKALTDILYGKRYHCLFDGKDLRITDNKAKLYYFEKVQDSYSYFITKYFMDRNINGDLVLLRRYENGDLTNTYFELSMDYDKQNRLISKRDSDGSNLIIDYSEFPTIKCYMNETLCKNMSKKMKWLQDAFSLEQQGRLELLSMDSDK